MERNLYADKPAGGSDWPDTPQGRQFAWAREQLDLILRRFKAVRSAAAFNPRNPPKIGT